MMKSIQNVKMSQWLGIIAVIISLLSVVVTLYSHKQDAKQDTIKAEIKLASQADKAIFSFRKLRLKDYWFCKHHANKAMRDNFKAKEIDAELDIAQEASNIDDYFPLAIRNKFINFVQYLDKNLANDNCVNNDMNPEILLAKHRELHRDMKSFINEQKDMGILF